MREIDIVKFRLVPLLYPDRELRFSKQIVLGSVYALIAVRFSLVFSILEIINFSHGSMVMMGVFVSLALGLAVPGLGFIGVAIVTMLVIALLGVLVERVAVAPLRSKGAERSLALVSALGAAILWA